MQPIQEGEKEVKDLEDWAAVQKVYKQTKSKRATAKILHDSCGFTEKGSVLLSQS